MRNLKVGSTGSGGGTQNVLDCPVFGAAKRALRDAPSAPRHPPDPKRAPSFRATSEDSNHFVLGVEEQQDTYPYFEVGVPKRNAP